MQAQKGLSMETIQGRLIWL